MSDVETRLERLEAESAIRALAARYNLAIDDHDLDTVADLFTSDARFHSRDGVLDATGRDAIVEQFKGRFSVLGPSNHVGHDHAIEVADDARTATGILSAHAEVHRNGTPMVAALRYADRYVRDEDGLWRFADRLLSFLYYVPLADYPGILDRPDRMRAYEEPAPADYPESLPTWKDYR